MCKAQGFSRFSMAWRSRTSQGGWSGVIPGNRDFLLGPAFTDRTGVQVLAPGVRMQRGENRWLLLHGDELCTQDVGYQRLRRVLRSPWTQGVVRRLPRRVQHALARRIRRASKRAVPQKAQDTVAMQPQAARQQIAAEKAQVLVCGHAHRYQEDALEGGAKWLVLNAFGAGDRDVLVIGERGDWSWEHSRA